MGAAQSGCSGRLPLRKLRGWPVFLAILAFHNKRSQFTSGAFSGRMPKGGKSGFKPAQNGVDGRVGQESGRAVANRTLGPTARSRLEKRSIRMKKPLFLALLSVAAVSATARDSHAWFLGCCCRDRCCPTFCCRPYNAFSPPCCCCPCCVCCMPYNNYGQPGPAPCGPYGQYGPYGPNGPYGPSCFGCPSYGPGCCTSGNCDVGCLPAPGSFSTAPGPVPTMPFPSQVSPGPQLQIPNPQVLNQSSYGLPMPLPMPTPPAYGHGFVQPAGYQAMNYPSYYAPPQAPAYWYGR
jgi:hypothetical protein